MTLGNKTLDDFLAPISAQLGHDTVPDAPTAKPDVPASARITDGLSHDQLVDMFVDEAQKVRVSVHRCKASEAASTIAAIIAQGEADNDRVVMGADDALANLGIKNALSHATIWDPAQEDDLIAMAKEAGYGITYANAGIAETGTIVQVINSSCGRSVSLLPLVHIAVLPSSSIVPTMRACLESLHGETGDHSGMPAQICFISGPSATSDIELVRVEGVHGPMYEHYVVVDDDIQEEPVVKGAHAADGVQSAQTQPTESTADKPGQSSWWHRIGRHESR